MERRILLSLAAAVLAAAALPTVNRIAWAQGYPTRAIHLVISGPPGAPPDILARFYGEKLSQDLKQPVVIENRAGASGTIGTEAVVRARPDGHTLLFTADLPLTMAPALVKLRYDPLHDLTPIAAVARADNILVVHPSAGIRSIAELVAAAKARPGTLTFSSAGNASPAHLCGEMIKHQAGIDLIHVPYAGSTPAMNAVLAGDVTMFCGPIPLALPHIKAASVHALGVTGVESSRLLPELAPLAASHPGLVVSQWYGVLAPAATPASVDEVLESELKKISADPELQRRLIPLGLDPEWKSGADLSRRIESDTARWRDFIKAANIRQE
jgi:tripartite-type tricarboxylate transporter receptor subunit TctC